MARLLLQRCHMLLNQDWSTSDGGCESHVSVSDARLRQLEIPVHDIGSHIKILHVARIKGLLRMV